MICSSSVYFTLFAGAFALVGGSPTPYASKCSSSSIPHPVVSGAAVLALSAAPFTNYLGISGNDVCQVNITITHPGVNDTVYNQVLLPLSGWNGRFQGVGGGGFLAGVFSSLAPIAAQGYSCASTTAGLPTWGNAESDASAWALVSEGNVNQYLLIDFAYRSIHDMSVIGKAVTHSFYGAAPEYSYWNGCSTGGRQGLGEAQKYPEDYDVAFVVMNNEHYAPLQCEFAAIDAATIDACDGLDGLVDGIISAPGLCKFDPHSLVGKSYTCNTDGSTRTFKNQTATIVQKIWEGPRTPSGRFLWYGITKGTNFSSLANTTVFQNGTVGAVAFEISDSWYRDFLLKDLTYDTSSITYAQFTTLFHAGHQEYDSVIGTADPDLSAFKARGGKMITWQGLADNVIMPAGTQLYYKKVASLDPQVHDFYRQFFSPGIGHCGGGTGVVPTDAIGQLRAWVENGTAPATLHAASEYPVNASSAYAVNGTNVRTQNLCPFPQVTKYNGKGDPSLASSYECAAADGWYDFGGPNGNITACAGWY
ncbi:hypothetical protein H2203_007177 [Taxawa tesnikishii (nom. ined.)]|nr:hypothetical protein H2203_007177 [Dothideales sp. JES 119]